MFAAKTSLQRKAGARSESSDSDRDERTGMVGRHTYRVQYLGLSSRSLRNSIRHSRCSALAAFAWLRRVGVFHKLCNKNLKEAELRFQNPVFGQGDKTAYLETLKPAPMNAAAVEDPIPLHSGVVSRNKSLEPCRISSSAVVQFVQQSLLPQRSPLSLKHARDGLSPLRSSYL